MKYYCQLGALLILFMAGQSLANISQSLSLKPVDPLLIKQGYHASFNLEKHFSTEMTEYEAEVLNDRYHVVSAGVLNNIIHIFINPYDFRYAGIKIPAQYQIKVVAKNEQGQIKTKHFQVKVIQ